MGRPEIGSKVATLLAVLFAWCPVALAQDSVVVLDENDSSADYREASLGAFDPPDTLWLYDQGKLPVTHDRAFSGTSSGMLQYRHTDGAWRLDVEPEGSVRYDISGFDSLIVYLNGPEAIDGIELPRIRLADGSGGETEPAWLSPLENVAIDHASSGFTGESTTNAVVTANYVDVLPAQERRMGYPEDLTITFADEPIDTSTVGIGLPAVPARFQVETEGGLQADFRFRDVDEDGTLSRTDEFIDVLLPEYDSDGSVLTWRFTLAPTTGPEPISPPGEGDVYQLAVTYEEFNLDSDPNTWQRLSRPLVDLTGEVDRTDFAAVVFSHGGPNEALRTLWFDQLTIEQNDDEAFLDMVQQATFDFFWHEANPANGLVRDRTTGNYSSIAATGFGLSALTVGIDRGWITHEQGRERIHTTLDFFWNAPQSTAPDATGYKGFFYHFLNMDTGRRSGTTELSTIDTALLLAGVLHVREVFAEDEEIRSLADSIYHRVDWAWMQHRHPTNPTAAISHGWRPESGFITNDWIGYNEAMILYIVALGSPTHSVGPDAWEAWVSGYGNQWRTEYGYTYLTFPPLFGHQYSHVWIDFRDIQDEYMRSRGIDYFENSRRATLAQRAYHVANPRGWPNYSKDEWGLTASDTPDGYRARGAPPPQNDDGTLVPTAPGGSIVFAPDESIAALRTMHENYGSELFGKYGFRDAYNVSRDWVAEAYLGIDQGPILLMIENYRTESIWDVTMRHEAIRTGLVRAGFTGVGLPSEDEAVLVDHLELTVYPNPVATQARVEYSVPETAPVRLVLYDVLGREVAVLEDGVKAAGRHESGVSMDGLSSGLYIVRLDSGMRRTSRVLTKLE